MVINAYLGFNGNCEEAFKFYEKVLGGKIEALARYGETPAAAQVPPDWKNKIIHARMSVGDNVLMGGDAPPDHYHAAAGMMVSVSVKEPAEAERIFKGLSEGGKVNMPIQETFWAQRFAMWTDRFGTPWMVNCEKAQRADSAA